MSRRINAFRKNVGTRRKVVRRMEHLIRWCESGTQSVANSEIAEDLGPTHETVPHFHALDPIYIVFALGLFRSRPYLISMVLDTLKIRRTLCIIVLGGLTLRLAQVYGNRWTPNPLVTA